MADALEAATGMPVAPVFWAACDDADWAEAAITHIATSRGLETLSLDGPATDGVAMADVPLGPMQAALQALRTASGSVAHESVLRVRSSGGLLDPATVPELFEPFRRAGVARTARSGAGLGLSIVRAAVQAHGGTVSAEPVVGGGLSVTVHLPAVP